MACNNLDEKVHNVILKDLTKKLVEVVELTSSFYWSKPSLLMEFKVLNRVEYVGLS